MSRRPAKGGSRFLYEPFERPKAPLEEWERAAEARWQALEERVARLEQAFRHFGKWLALLLSGALGIAAAQVLQMLLQNVQK